MKDPYSVLGVSASVSDDEVKRAYRDLARKYHPDNYQNNPLADLASEKMKEINEAYDTITKMRSSGHSSGASSYTGYNPTGSRSSAGSRFAEARNAINRGDLDGAERILNAATNRDAEWNFLMGSVYYKRGWMDDARSFYQRAVNMDPANGEYRQALAYMNSGGAPYRQAGYGTPAVGMDACDICTAMMCTNMICGGCRF